MTFKARLGSRSPDLQAYIGNTHLKTVQLSTSEADWLETSLREHQASHPTAVYDEVAIRVFSKIGSAWVDIACPAIESQGFPNHGIFFRLSVHIADYFTKPDITSSGRDQKYPFRDLALLLPGAHDVPARAPDAESVERSSWSGASRQSIA